MNFSFTRLELPEVILVDVKAFGDARGFFMESYKQSAFDEIILEQFVQDNHSRSAKGVLRGLHFQNPPFAQGKLVRVVRGRILDVAVDIRKGSPNYGKWVSAELSEENRQMLYVPTGFAHGFLTLSDIADVMYKTTAEYAPDCDSGFAWDDPAVGVDWQLEQLEGVSPQLSGKDDVLPPLAEAKNDFVYPEAAS
ncbi:MAG: dTDP-4-dehydrorhamnose 3,5-epimerase [Deinococcota bacterium]